MKSNDFCLFLHLIENETKINQIKLVSFVFINYKIILNETLIKPI